MSQVTEHAVTITDTDNPKYPILITCTCSFQCHCQTEAEAAYRKNRHLADSGWIAAAKGFQVGHL